MNKSFCRADKLKQMFFSVIRGQAFVTTSFLFLCDCLSFLRLEDQYDRPKYQLHRA